MLHEDAKLVAIRVPSTKSRSQFCYLLDEGIENRALVLQEDTGMVDGIGGATWDGALVLAHVLQQALVRDVTATAAPSSCFSSSSYSSRPLRVVELGCGAGLLGILAHTLQPLAEVVLTDKEPDLASANVAASRVYASMLEFLEAERHPEGCHASSKKADTDEAANATDAASGAQMRVLELPFGEQSFASSELACSPPPDLILGAEIAVLYKQQPLLCQTLDCLAGPHSLVLLSIDGFPAASSSAEAAAAENAVELRVEGAVRGVGGPPKEGYAALLDADMHRRGFLKRVLAVGQITWLKLGHRQSRPVQEVAQAMELLSALGAAPTGHGATCVATFRDVAALSSQPGQRVPAAASSAGAGEVTDVQEVHHVVAYFRPELLRDPRGGTLLGGLGVER